MTIDFSVITIYELMALILAAVAIVIPPLAKLTWERLIRKPKINYYHDKKIRLYFNLSGSYVRINGTLEALNQPVLIKDISVSIRKKNSGKLDLSWSIFFSPVTQHFIGAMAQANEVAHPFRIEANSVSCAFIEFADRNEIAFRNINLSTKELFDTIPALMGSAQNYQTALSQYENIDLYKNACQNISKELFWDIGKYEVLLTVSYLDKQKTFKYYFDIHERECAVLQQNIKECLLAPLKNAFNVKSNFQEPTVELREFK